MSLSQISEEKVRGKGLLRRRVDRRERMKRDSGMKDRDERSRGMEILITEGLTKIKPTEPLRLGNQITRKNRN